MLQEREGYDLAVHNVPGERAYATSDLFEPHPRKAGLWNMYVAPESQAAAFSHDSLPASAAKTTSSR